MFEVDYKPAVKPLFHVRVCINRRLNTDNLPNCAGRGSREMADVLEKRIAEENLPVNVLRGPCMNNCAMGPNIKIQAGEMLNLNGDLSDERLNAVMDSIRAELKKRETAASDVPTAETP
jgi:NADH:ubiquinone oxidoreductase subunit E